MHDDPLIGTVLSGRFRVESLLGHGQNARVYRAVQLSMNRTVALKLLHHELDRDDASLVRFQREVSAVALLRSPHSIEFYDYGRTENGDLYIAMEYLEGETLRERLERHTKIAPREAIAIVRQIAASLGEAHAAGIIHRDLKPENIHFCAHATPIVPFVKVLDFGFAKVLETDEDSVNVTGKHTTVGTPAYLAPERAVAARQVDWRSDLYSLGVIAFEMLVGQRPYLADNPVKMLIAHVREPIPDASRLGVGLPRDLDAFFHRALAKDPHERFSNADSFAHAMTNALKERWTV